MRNHDFNELICFKTSVGVHAEISGISYYPIHSHNESTEILCVLKGTVNVYDAAIKYTMSPNEIHIFNSGDPHRIVSSDPDSAVLIVQFDKNHFAKYFSNIKLAYFVAHATDASMAHRAEMKYLRFLMAKIYTEYTKSNPSEMVLHEDTKALIELLYKYFHDYSYQVDSSNGYTIVRRRNIGQDEDDFNKVYRIADYIESNFSEKLSLTEIAQQEYLSTSYLSRYIKENIGVTFSELLSIARCSEAERLLAATNKSIDQIATEVGFSNRGHLTTQFQRWYSTSPSAYRKSVLEDFTKENNIKYFPVERDLISSKINTLLNG